MRRASLILLLMPLAAAAQGMPAFFYRIFYRAHSVKSLERNIMAGLLP